MESLIKGLAPDVVTPEFLTRVLPLRSFPATDVGGGSILETVLNVAVSGEPIQLLGLPDNTDDVAVSIFPNKLATIARLTGFDGTDWDRLRTLVSNADAQAAAVDGLLGVVARLQALDEGGDFVRLRSANGSSTNVAPTQGMLNVICNLFARRNAGAGDFSRLFMADAAALAQTSSEGALLTQDTGCWAINHSPAANTRATITRGAGGAGVRHVCNAVTASLVGAGANNLIQVRLRDGASGAGTILWTCWLFNGAAQPRTEVSLSGLNIVGSAATAMTLEFDVAPAGGAIGDVSLVGFDAS